VKEAENELGKIIAERIKRENEIIEIRKEIVSLLEVTKFNLEYLHNRDSRIELLETRIEQLKNEIKNVQELEDIQREKLAVLMKDEKMIEKHKEKHFDAFKEEVKKEENEFLDEIAAKLNRN
jgi:flagellar FliJ protein